MKCDSLAVTALLAMENDLKKKIQNQNWVITELWLVDDEKLFNGAMVLQKELMRKMCVFLIPVYILILCLTNKHVDIFVWWCAMEFFFFLKDVPWF